MEAMSIDPIRMFGRHHRTAIVLIAGSLFIGSACSSGPSRDITTGVEGTISAGPTCPVEREGTPCPASPIQAQIDVLAADGKRSAQTVSDADGRFSVRVAPGRYTLHVALATAFPRCPDTAVTLPDDGTVGADIVCDTGIR